MRANPGGEIDPADVLGRDDLIRELWRVLARQSLELTAERRIGKSSVIKKMTSEAPDGFAAVYQDLEGVRTRLEFVAAVSRPASVYLSRRKRRAERFQRLAARLGGARIGAVTLPKSAARDWKDLLVAVAQDLSEHLDETLVFFWDEMPFMLQNITEEEGVGAAREVLDVLRGIRQSCRKLRMVFTGSIGLHHVLLGLREESKVSHAPMNDMDRVDVPPLMAVDAIDLSQRIIAGEGLTCADPLATSAALAAEVDGVAYYVHLVLDGLVKERRAATPESVRVLVRSRIHDPTDPWNLSHFYRRIEPYYGGGGALARLLLDSLAGVSRPMSRLELVNVVSAQLEETDAHAVVEMLARLMRDHYLVADDAGNYRFCYAVVKRWWRHHQVDASAGAGEA